MELSPQPPLSPSFIFLSSLKFINEIYSVMASILTTWEWTAATQLYYVESSEITLGPYTLHRNVIKSLIYNMRIKLATLDITKCSGRNSLMFLSAKLYFAESFWIFQCSICDH